jgi:acetoin utilization deacetylase AcuC-like enzyme
MTTLYITHDAFLGHETPPGHPERSARLDAVNEALSGAEFAALERVEAPLGNTDMAALVHPRDYIEALEAAVPADDTTLVSIDGDTAMSHGSWEAALRGLGAVCHAVDRVFNGEAANAFCAVRPPGHHAETRRAMGFCLFSNAAIAAHHARAERGIERCAVVDFDVHHGNGTQEIFWSDKDMFYGSTHQMPLFPGTGAKTETGAGNIFNAPLRAGDGGEIFKSAMNETILPALGAFRPDLVIISAGFDAHARDPLGSLRLAAEDFAWATLMLMELADKYCSGRVVSMLEGGYDLEGLAQSAAAHVGALRDH